MRIQRTTRRTTKAIPPEIASAPTFQELLSHQQASASDSSITWLYRATDNGSTQETASMPTAGGTARRYKDVAYLQVDWENLHNGIDAAEPASCAVSSRGLSNVYDRLLARVERRIDAIVAADLLLLIHASRTGLSLHELVAISGCSIAQASDLVAALRNHLMDRGERVMPLNNYIGRAIERRYAAPSPERLVEARRAIVAYFERLPLSARVAEELPWQLLELGALDRLEQYVTDASVAAALCEAGRRGDLYLYWNALRGRVDLGTIYRTANEGEGTSEILALLERYTTVVSPAGRSSDDVAVARAGMQTFGAGMMAS